MLACPKRKILLGPPPGPKVRSGVAIPAVLAREKLAAESMSLSFQNGPDTVDATLKGEETVFISTISAKVV